jgi:hypothetical protein
MEGLSFRNFPGQIAPGSLSIDKKLIYDKILTKWQCKLPRW